MAIPVFASKLISPLRGYWSGETVGALAPAKDLRCPIRLAGQPRRPSGPPANLRDFSPFARSRASAMITK